jgi:predicted N-acetyltransferase YhbS
MTPKDIPFGLKLSSSAGWNQTAADWAMLLEQSAAGSFVACYDGIEAGTVTTVTYDQQIHWIGMLLVAEEFQRRGIGRALLQAAIEAVKGQGAAWLDATPAGKKLYDRLGFQQVYGLARWLRPPAPMGMRPVSTCGPLLPEVLPFVGEYDRLVFGADRSGILTTFQRNTPGLALYLEQAGKLSGYCLGRHGRKYIHIGPLIADRLEIGRDLLLSALQSCARLEVIIDTPFHLPEWNQFIRELGFVEQRPLIRMCLGEFTLPERHPRQMAIAGPEMG